MSHSTFNESLRSGVIKAPVIDELNQTKTVYPGTSFRIVYDINGATLQNRLT